MARTLTLYTCIDESVHTFVFLTPCQHQKGDKTQSRTEMNLPAGWVWEDEWQIDLSRAVDEEGL